MTIRFTSIKPKSFKLLDESRLFTGLRAGQQDYLERVRDFLLEDYNEVPEGTTYKRKFPRGINPSLGGGWQIHVSPDGTVGELTNSTKYAALVQGNRQREIFAELGWHTVAEAKEILRDDYKEIMQDVLDSSVLRPLGSALSRFARSRPRDRKGRFLPIH